MNKRMIIIGKYLQIVKRAQQKSNERLARVTQECNRRQTEHREHLRSHVWPLTCHCVKYCSPHGMANEDEFLAVLLVHVRYDSWQV